MMIILFLKTPKSALFFIKSHNLKQTLNFRNFFIKNKLFLARQIYQFDFSKVDLIS